MKEIGGGISHPNHGLIGGKFPFAHGGSQLLEFVGIEFGEELNFSEGSRIDHAGEDAGGGAPRASSARAESPRGRAFLIRQPGFCFPLSAPPATAPLLH